MIGAIWFLLALAFATYFVNCIYKSKHRVLYIILIAYLGYKTSQYIWLPFSIQAGMVATIFMYIGIIAKDNEIFTKKFSPIFYIINILIVAFCIIYAGKLYMVSNTYQNGILDVIGAVSASFLCIKLSMCIEKYFKYISKFLIFIGSNSLICLCIHLISLDCFYWKTVRQMLTDIGIENAVIRNIVIQILWVIIMLIVVKTTIKFIKIIKNKLINIRREKSYVL